MSSIKLDGVYMKVIPDSGTYYKFEVSDDYKKKAIFKLDRVNTRPVWNSSEWVQKELGSLE